MSDGYIIRHGGSGGAIGAVAKPDDPVTWQKCAGIKDTVKDTAEILSDEKRLHDLFSRGNAMDYLRRSPALLKAVTRDRAAWDILTRYCRKTPVTWGDNYTENTRSSEYGKLESRHSARNPWYYQGRMFNYLSVPPKESYYSYYFTRPGWIQINARERRRPFVVVKAALCQIYNTGGNEVIVQGVKPDGSVFEITGRTFVNDEKEKEQYFPAPKTFEETVAFRFYWPGSGGQGYYTGGFAWII